MPRANEFNANLGLSNVAKPKDTPRLDASRTMYCEKLVFAARRYRDIGDRPKSSRAYDIASNLLTFGQLTEADELLGCALIVGAGGRL